MKITRPNMADLSRTFASSGESDSKAVPEVSVDVDPRITPVMEFCRPVARERPQSTTVPIDESTYMALNSTVVGGTGALSTPLFTLRRGVWRFTIFLAGVATGGTPPAGNYMIVALVGPDGLFGPGVHIFVNQNSVTTVGQNDWLIHLPSDDWTVSLEIADPAGVLTNRLRGSVYACHLL